MSAERELEVLKRWLLRTPFNLEVEDNLALTRELDSKLSGVFLALGTIARFVRTPFQLAPAGTRDFRTFGKQLVQALKDLDFNDIIARKKPAVVIYKMAGKNWKEEGAKIGLDEWIIIVLTCIISVLLI